MGRTAICMASSPPAARKATVYILEIGTDGTGLSNVRSFHQHGGDGRSPSAAPVRASDGFLYGTASGGSAYNDRAMYRFSEDASTTRWSILS